MSRAWSRREGKGGNAIGRHWRAFVARFSPPVPPASVTRMKSGRASRRKGGR